MTERTCPDCGSDDITTAVDVTFYNGTHHEAPGEGDMVPLPDPEKNPVRAFCSTCGCYVQLTPEEAKTIVSEIPL